MDLNPNSAELALGFDTQYIENLDTEKLKELYLKASYILSLSLCQSVGRTHVRLGTLSSFLETMENQLIDIEFGNLTLDDQIKLYTVIANSSSRVFDNILKLNASMATNIDAVSKIEDSKSKLDDVNRIDKRDPKIKELLQNINAEMERRKQEKTGKSDLQSEDN